MSVTPSCSADQDQSVGSVGDQVRRKVHGSHSLLSSMFGAQPHQQKGFSPDYHGARNGGHVAPLSLPA